MFLFWFHQCLLSSNLVLVCKCLEWNWQNSVKTLNVKFSQKTKFIFQPLNILTHFQIIYCICSSLPNCSQYLVTSVVISRYRTNRLAKFRHLFFSFRKVWGYSTLPISWFINFRSFIQFLPPHPTLQLSIHHSHPTHQPALHHYLEDNYFQKPTTTI